MRKLILKMSVSVDGFVGGVNNESDWIFVSMDEGATDWTMQSIWQAGVHIMGSRTFHDMASYWPSSNEVYAAPMNEIPKVVFSKNPQVTSQEARATTRSVRDASNSSGAKEAAARKDAPPADPSKEQSWRNARVMSGDLATDIGQLKSEPGKDIMAHGGASFARSLVRLGLVDEFQLLVHPFVLGQGLPIFSELPKRIALRLVSASTFPSGAAAHVYRPKVE
ncbi:MAG: dihydrofolate reductase family protein [Gemmatimonadota bacterium]